MNKFFMLCYLVLLFSALAFSLASLPSNAKADEGDGWGKVCYRHCNDAEQQTSCQEWCY